MQCWKLTIAHATSLARRHSKPWPSSLYDYVLRSSRKFAQPRTLHLSTRRRWSGSHLECKPGEIRSGIQQTSQIVAVAHDATIFAVSTAPGRAAIAIIRCSGPACLEIYHALCPNRPQPAPRKATLRTLFAPSKSPSSVLDTAALILYFPPPSTVTGEPVIELHVHGGPATVRALLTAISSLSTPSRKIRYAEPGEFTRRAFYNDRLDLTQIEALGDTLAAETEQQRQLAVRGSSSVLAQRYENWRFQLLQARGELEALIDFSEDQHFDESPVELTQNVASKVQTLSHQINASLRNAARGELLRTGIKVALLGAPNVGKSSLLNRIVGREVAIVSSVAGTTRDVVETNVDIGGFFCNLGDLAGLRENKVDEVEEEGMRRAKARALDADVVIAVSAIERSDDGALSVAISKEVKQALEQCDLTRQRILYVVNKIDMSGSCEKASQIVAHSRTMLAPATSSGPLLQVFGVTCKNPMPAEPNASSSHMSDDGVQAFLAGLTEAFQSLTEAVEIPGLDPAVQQRQPAPALYEESLGASERQARLLAECQNHLHLFLEAVSVPEGQLDQEVDIVLAAESLRSAAECLSKITGRGEGGDVEDVLGVVFENFCVGK